MLFQPLRLGAQTIPSRIVFAAHQTNFATHNQFTARHAAYYAARAAGGAGLIVLEGSVVHPSDWLYEYAIFGYDARAVAGYRQVADAIHTHGALALAHLSHSGGQGTNHYSQRPLWAPSPVPEVNSREVPQAMEPEDIAEVVDGFAQAAEYALAGGLDGVEINAGQDSLLRQCMSPLTNQRGDEYGGSLEGRLRLARAVIAAVRRQIGQAAIVGLRLSGDEYAPWAGLKPEDVAEIARRLADDGQLDFISVTSGSIYAAHMTRAGLYMPPGYAAPLAAGIRQAVQARLPVFAQGSLVDPTMAETLLAEEQADAVEMTRALIADPDWPRKAREGRLADIRPCILCNQDCVVRTVQNPRLSCVVNPAAGYETETEFDLARRINSTATPERPAVKSSQGGAGSRADGTRFNGFDMVGPEFIRGGKRVLVVGGGPAGLEAARVAAWRGHEVTLVEQSDRLGGAVRLAANAPGRERLALAVDWLEEQIRSLGVTVRLGETMTAERVLAEPLDGVIVAVGGKPKDQRLMIDTQSSVSSPQSSVISPRALLAGRLTLPPGRAVVVDHIGDAVGMSVTEWLADRGWQVEVVTTDMFVGQKLTVTLELTPWNQRARAKGIVFRPMTEVARLDGRNVIGVDVFGRHAVVIEAVDVVVDVDHERPDEDLYFALKAVGLRVYRAGDCVAPRKIGHAILEGYRVGRIV